MNDWCKHCGEDIVWQDSAVGWVLVQSYRQASLGWCDSSRDGGHHPHKSAEVPRG